MEGRPGDSGKKTEEVPGPDLCAGGGGLREVRFVVGGVEGIHMTSMG